MTAPILQVEDLRTFFLRGAVWCGGTVDGVSFSIAKGEILGLVGASGSGKSLCFASDSGATRVFLQQSPHAVAFVEQLA